MKFNKESRQSIYFELSYVLAGQWSPETMGRLEFQKALAGRGLDFPRTSVGPNEFKLVRIEPSSLQVRIGAVGPRISSITVSSERPEHTLDMFIKEAEAVSASYRDIWLKDSCQVFQTSGRIRHLYSCSDHSFKFLWEDRLGQRPQDFEYLGKRTVLGGGLRLVMPPVKDEAEPVQIEVKIETFFSEPKNMFVETFFLWPKPRFVKADDGFGEEYYLHRVENFAAGEVCDFILKEKAGE
jgi:hypothetical protein